MAFCRLSLLLLLLSVAAYGQNACIPITRSNDYYSASATNADEAEARANARSLLIEQISTTISSRTDLATNEVDSKSLSSFSSITRSVTQLHMTGVQYLVCSKDKRDGFTVMAFISKADLLKSRDDVSKEVAEYMTLMDEKRESGADYLPEAYTAFLHTFLTPYPIEFSQGTTKTKNARVYLETLLKTYLSKIKLTSTGVEENKEFPDQLIIGLKAEGAEPSAMKFVFDNPEFNARCEIVGMKGGLNLLMDPVAPTQTFKGTLILKPISVSSELAEIDRIVTIHRDVEVNANMMSVISVDFSIVEKGDAIELLPAIKHLSIRKFEWTSLKQLLSVDQRPTIARKEVSKEITLTINGSRDLSITKNIDGDASSFRKKVEEVSTIKTEDKTEETVKNEKLVITPVKITNATAEKFRPVDSFTELQPMLLSYKKEGKISYGRESDFMNPSNCWIFIVDPATKKVMHLLSPKDAAGRTDVKSGKSFTDFESNFKGLVSIWAEFY